MAEMKLDRPYMELHTGSDIAFGGYPVYMPIGEVPIPRATPTEELRNIFERETLSKLDDIFQILRILHERQNHMERLLEDLKRPWYARFWQWLFRS